MLGGWERRGHASKPFSSLGIGKSTRAHSHCPASAHSRPLLPAQAPPPTKWWKSCVPFPHEQSGLVYPQSRAAVTLHLSFEHFTPYSRNLESWAVTPSLLHPQHRTLGGLFCSHTHFWVSCAALGHFWRCPAWVPAARGHLYQQRPGGLLTLFLTPWGGRSPCLVCLTPRGAQ